MEKSIYNDDEHTVSLSETEHARRRKRSRFHSCERKHTQTMLECESDEISQQRKLVVMVVVVVVIVVVMEAAVHCIITGALRRTLTLPQSAAASLHCCRVPMEPRICGNCSGSTGLFNGSMTVPMRQTCAYSR